MEARTFLQASLLPLLKTHLYIPEREILEENTDRTLSDGRVTLINIG